MLRGRSLASSPLTHTLDKNDTIVTITSLFVHLLDQLDWELLSVSEVNCACKMLIERLVEFTGVDYEYKDVLEKNNKNAIKEFTNRFEEYMSFVGELYVSTK